MNVLQGLKFAGITPPAAIVDNAAVTTASIDTKGYKKALIVVYLGATDIAVSALKLRHSDDDSTYADVTGGDYSSDGTLPSASADNTAVAWHVNLQGKKRYLDVSLTGGDGTAGAYFTALAFLGDAEEMPNSATERGFGQELFV
jgi:hypothetical protein